MDSSSFRVSSSALQGPHQVAKNISTIALPLNFSEEVSSPFKFFNLKGVAEVPASS